MKEHFIDHDWFAVSERPLEREAMLDLLDAKIDLVNKIADLVDSRVGCEVTERVLSRAMLLRALMNCKECLTDAEPNFNAGVFWGMFAYATATLIDAEKRVDLKLSHLKL